MSYACLIIADSISPAGHRITTFEVTMPRIVLAELNTHRMFSRNSASSRAIPVEKQIARVLEDPFIPIYWGKNQKGMQAEQELDPAEQAQCLERWLHARDNAVKSAQQLLELGVHKQITNRLLEPFMWHTVIITATDYSNFFNLRANPMAQPEIQRPAYMMMETYEASVPTPLKTGEWHLPYVQPHELDGSIALQDLIKLSVARCARVSYLTHDGKRDLGADFTLHDRLAEGGHMSPFEHAASAMSEDELSRNNGYCRNFRGWVPYRATIAGEEDIIGFRRVHG